MRRLVVGCLWMLLLAPFAPAVGDEPELEPISLESFELLDSRGRNWSLDDFQSDSILVIAFLGTECPLAQHYSVRLRELAAEYQSRGVRVIAVMSNRQDSLEEIQAFASRQQLEFPVLKDPANRLADNIGAERTPEVFVFDASRQLRYRGRVDDQYGVGYVLPEPRRRDLQLALDELLAGGEVTLPRTRALGCIIGRRKSAEPQGAVSYAGEIAALLNRRCVECHREGEIAPFSLTDYDEVAGWADMIAEVVSDGRMPPWHASPDHARFGNDRSLSDEEKQLLLDWAAAGAPAGDLTRLPELPAKPEGWQLPRQPDRVIPISSQPFDVRATGVVPYQYFTFDPQLDEDVWIEAAELKPGNREVVHHILAFAVPKGQRRGLDAARGFLFGYVPGQRLEAAPAGHAKKIPAGSELIFQVHYTPIGTPQQDQSLLGLVFADPATVTHEIQTNSALQTRFKIPAGDANHQVVATGPAFPAQATLLSFSPHMHVRGKSYRYELLSVDGGKETLLDIPAYDFNWQTTYVLAEPRPVPEGSRFVCTAAFDNSAANLNNPDPSQTVTWGDQTWDEMMIGYYHYSIPIQPAGAASPKVSAGQAERLRRFDQLDRDGDGTLAREQTPAALLAVFDQLDRDGDKTLTRQEVAAGD